MTCDQCGRALFGAICPHCGPARRTDTSAESRREYLHGLDRSLSGPGLLEQISAAEELERTTEKDWLDARQAAGYARSLTDWDHKDQLPDRYLTPENCELMEEAQAATEVERRAGEVHELAKQWLAQLLGEFDEIASEGLSGSRVRLDPRDAWDG